MKPILLILLLALPAFALSKKPPEPKCDRTIRLTKEWEGKVQCFGLTSEESRVLKELAQKKIQQEIVSDITSPFWSNVWAGDTTQMSKPNAESLQVYEYMVKNYPSRTVRVINNGHGGFYGESDIPCESLYNVGYQNGWNNAKNYFKPQAPKVDTVFIYKLDPATREWLDYCQREMISMRWYYYTPESLWTAYIKGTHRCEDIRTKNKIIGGAITGLLIGFLIGWKGRKQWQKYH